MGQYHTVASKNIRSHRKQPVASPGAPLYGEPRLAMLLAERGSPWVVHSVDRRMRIAFRTLLCMGIQMNIQIFYEYLR